jgi:hypothetical protein
MTVAATVGAENGNDHGLELKADHGPPQLREHSAR